MSYSKDWGLLGVLNREESVLLLSSSLLPNSPPFEPHTPLVRWIQGSNQKGTRTYVMFRSFYPKLTYNQFTKSDYVLWLSYVVLYNLQK